MTVDEFARSIIECPEYRQSIVARAAAGTLSEDLEMLIWDVASNRIPMMRDPLSKLVDASRVVAPAQSKTLALVRSSLNEEVPS